MISVRKFIAPVGAVVCLVALTCQSQVRTGADVLIQEKLDILRGKNVALVTNHTGRLGTGELLVDALVRSGIKVVRLFGPEHGISGMAAAGETVTDSVDAKTGIPVVSLYGKTHKPTAEMLLGVDILVYDIQDVGARFYTYISTMALSMEAAAELRIPFVVLDRPNPLGGEKVDGPILDDSLHSLVGIAPIPIVYGLTSGELARFLNGEKLLAGGVQADLSVIQMKGWDRSMTWNETNIEWVPPSPNLRTAEAALVYPATCLVEATNVSEGRGTESPFLTIGAPFVDGERLAVVLEREQLPGLRFRATTFTPASSKWKGRKCGGVRISLTDPATFRPTRSGLKLLKALQDLYPEKFVVQKRSFERLFGVGGVWEELYARGGAGEESRGSAGGQTIETVIRESDTRIDGYRLASRRYLLYPGK
jgi:uncharacterized protein YbbC (DUF1343 family)